MVVAACDLPMESGASECLDRLEQRHVVAALNEPVPPAEPQVRPAAANADWAVRLLDLKGTARPPTFDGRDVSWPDFKFKFEATAELLHMAVQLRESQTLVEPIEVAQLSDDARE